MNLFENIRLDDGMKVDLHIFENEIDITIIVGLQDIQQANDILMVMGIELLQEHDLAKGALCVGRILKGIEDLLQGDRTTSGTIDGLPNDTVSLTTKGEREGGTQSATGGGGKSAGRFMQDCESKTS